MDGNSSRSSAVMDDAGIIKGHAHAQAVIREMRRQRSAVARRKGDEKDQSQKVNDFRSLVKSSEEPPAIGGTTEGGVQFSSDELQCYREMIKGSYGIPLKFEIQTHRPTRSPALRTPGTVSKTEPPCASETGHLQQVGTRRYAADDDAASDGTWSDNDAGPHDFEVSPGTSPFALLV